MSTFADRLKERMAALNMIQRDLAQIAGVKPPLLSAFMGGSRKPGAESLLDLSSALQCDPYWLLRGKGKSPAVAIERPSVQMAPLLEWRDISDWTAKGESSTEHCLPVPVKSGLRTFAYTVTGEAMAARFETHDVVFIDPSIIKAEPGSFVLVFPAGNLSIPPLLRQLQLVDNVLFYATLNKELPPEMKFISVLETDVLAGQVVAHFKKV